MPETEAGALPAWAQQATAIIGFVWLLFVTIRGVIADRRKAGEDEDRNKLRRKANAAYKRGNQNTEKLGKLDSEFETVKQTSERLIDLLRTENKELRRRYDERVEQHNAEVVELRSEIKLLRDELKSLTEDNRRRQADYDKSRVEIHTLRNDLASASGKVELLTAENAELKAQNADLLLRQTPPMP